MWIESKNKFVYDTQTKQFAASNDWRLHHEDLIAQMHGDKIWKDPDFLDKLLYGSNINTRFIYGEHYPDEEPFIHHEMLLSPEQRQEALNQYTNWLYPPWTEHTAGAEDGRYAWLINHKGLQFGQLGQHHVDLGWSGGEIAQGDVLVNTDLNGTPTPGQTTLRVLTLDYNHDWNSVVDYVEQEWDKTHPGLEIDKFENLAAHPEAWYEDPNDQWEGLTNHASHDIIGGVKISAFSKKSFNEPDIHTDPDGYDWKLYQMESGEYPNHHAIMVDNDHRRMFINYHGHHGPMMEAAMNSGIPGHDFYGTTQGHYRLEPSEDEPFGEGWGFHHGSINPFQEGIFSDALKKYHGVDNLEKAWIQFKEATFKWLQHISHPTKNWKALFDRDTAVLYLWTTGNNAVFEATYLNSILGNDAFFKNGNIKKTGNYTQAEGTYTTISYILPTGAKDIEKEKAKVKELLEKALVEKWPTVTKETHLKPKSLRFMVEKCGHVIIGDYKTHYDLIADFVGMDIATKYSNFDVQEDTYPFVTGGFLDEYGTIRLIHTPGEGEYAPIHVGNIVYDEVVAQGKYANGQVQYEDWRVPNKPVTVFNLKGGTA